MGNSEIAIARTEVVRTGLEKLPPLISDAGERAGRRFIEFFMGNIRNKNTRLAYARAVGQFMEVLQTRREHLC